MCFAVGSARQADLKHRHTARDLPTFVASLRRSARWPVIFRLLVLPWRACPLHRSSIEAPLDYPLYAFFGCARAKLPAGIVRCGRAHGIHHWRDAALGWLHLLLLLRLLFVRNLLCGSLACNRREDEEENRNRKPAAKKEQFAFA